MIDPNSSGLQPVPENDLGLLPANGSLTINALDNDFDPAGGCWQSKKCPRPVHPG